ncbi:MAG: hypothetical protein NTX97_10015 [Bacteroidetes bacterium]|nr:hypothetical protein [Bacteroidota bacterium]
MRFILIFIIVGILASCKSPLPVYFDKPIGIQQDSFSKSIQGNFYPLEDILNKGLVSFEEKYYIKNGKLVIKNSKTVLQDTTSSAITENETVLYNDTTLKTSRVEEENNFYKIAALNSIALINIDSSIECITKKNKIVFGFLKISKNKILLNLIDSLANNYEVDLFQLNEKLKLTSYKDDYYLNVLTPFGWEYLKIEVWNNGEFLNLLPFYFTTYNDKTDNVKEFLTSTEGIYPNLKPIYNKAHLIIGLKAKSNPKLVKEKFKKSETNIEFIKVK